MRLLPALLLLAALPALAQTPGDDYPLRIEISPDERPSTVAVSWASEGAEYACDAEVSFGSTGRNGPFLELTATDEGCIGSGPMPPPAQLRVVRFRTDEGVLTLRIQGPPANQGWEEGVAAARVRFVSDSGGDAEGEASCWIGPDPDRGIVKIYVGGFTITPDAFNLGDLILK